MKVISNKKKELSLWRDKLSENLKGSSFIESRLMGIEVLPRLIVQLQKRSNNCPECNSLYHETIGFVDQIKEVANPENIGYRTQFELSTSKSLKHLKTTHSSYPKGKLFSIILGSTMLFGVFTAIITATLLNLPMFSYIILFWIISTIIGYVIGKSYEKLLHKKDRIF